MQVITLVDATVEDESTAVELPSTYDAHPEAFIQIEISGTFTCQILGKLHGDATYVELVAAVTANTIQPVTYMPYIQVTTSGGASTPICSVYMMIGEGKFGRRLRVDAPE